MAARVAKENVHLIVDSDRSERTLISAIKDSFIGSAAATSAKRFIVIFSVDLSGEPNTQPWLRGTPYNAQNHKRRNDAVVKARFESRGGSERDHPSEIPNNELFVFLDGGKHGVS